MSKYSSLKASSSLTIWNTCPSAAGTGDERAPVGDTNRCAWLLEAVEQLDLHAVGIVEDDQSADEPRSRRRPAGPRA
jgi:hypothetical protein